MKISPRDKLILTGVILAVVAIIAAALLIVPQVNTIKQLSNEAEQANQQYDEAKALLQQRQDMKDRAAQTDAEYLRLSNEIPESPELPSLIIELQELALQSGVSFEALRPSDPVSSADAQSQSAGSSGGSAAPSASGSPEYVIVPFNVSVRGSWSDTIDFMSRLQKMTRAVRTVEFATGTDNQQQEQQDVTSDQVSEFTNFKLEAYCYPTSTSTTSQ